MTRKYTERLDVDYREYINILKLCLLVDEQNPKQTRITTLIKKREEEIAVPYKETDVNAGINGTSGNHSTIESIVLKIDSDPTISRYRAWKRVTQEYLSKSDLLSQELVSDVYVLRKYNVQGSAMRHCISERSAYRLIKKWLEGYKQEIWNDAYQKK